MNYGVVFESAAENQLLGKDFSVRKRLIQRIARMPFETPGRHMEKGLPYFVAQAGQYRIIYTCKEGVKRIYFVGDHKEYERWYKQL
ncbi:MAG: hypothetical protein V1787_00775 [Candidatus Micrarchaeota archaeon]